MSRDAPHRRLHRDDKARLSRKRIRKEGTLVRKLGVAFMGLIGGLLVGFLVHEVIARIAMSGSGQLPDSLPLALVLGFLAPALAVVGAVVALVIDDRMRRR
jgi:hypothetical protein